jgi:energy-converting hydrogenase B subunit Q
VQQHTLTLRVRDQLGVLGRVAGLLADQGALITGLDLGAATDGLVLLTVEVEVDASIETIIQAFDGIDDVVECCEPPPMQKVFGARVIVIGGGAQVAAVASGAVQEADRHNIRGERISVDTIPLVGEEAIAEAVRAVPRLPRARALVLAGSLMGGEITAAVREVRELGIIVLVLSMAGSVTEAADLVVSDPLQAGVMAVMHVARTARFDIERVRGRRF